MKLVQLFDDFLRETVNLNQARIDTLDASVQAIKTFVEKSSYEPTILYWRAQGSWAHQTIIKPVDQGEFDADLLLFLRPINGWSASKYIDSLYDVFQESGIYQEKVKRWSHCVTITYASEKKIDVAPCLSYRDTSKLEVCNRISDTFQHTEPIRYTNWLLGQNANSGKNSFRKVVRLVKYLRDIKKRFTCSSVLLTTLLGNQISSVDKGSEFFSDTPTALKTVFGRLDDWLQLHVAKPRVVNPFLPVEDFSEAWSDQQYKNFREMIHKYRGWIDEAYDEKDRNASIAKWRRVFGDEFAHGVEITEGKSIGKSAIARLKESVGAAAAFAGDLVDAVKMFGANALPPGFDRRPYMKPPPWKLANVGRFSISVRAKLYASKGYDESGEVQSLGTVRAGCWIEFSVVTSNGLPPSKNDFYIKWRVTNTDEEAYAAKQLRGDFYDPTFGNVRQENLKYRGVHIVEAFVIRRRDDALVAASAPFHVTIE